MRAVPRIACVRCARSPGVLILSNIYKCLRDAQPAGSWLADCTRLGATGGPGTRRRAAVSPSQAQNSLQ
jgi:hypothetical protein